MPDRGAADVSRAPRARARGVQRFVHSGQNLWVLAHPEVIVAAPDGDVLRRPIRLGPDRVRKLALRPRDDGRVDVWVISDDNFSIMQRTLLAKLVFDPGA